MSWTIDPAHTDIRFSVRHMMISTVRGSFEEFTGTVDFDENDPTATQIDVTIQADSVNTREPKRDGHLKSPDFFDAETYPALTFKSTRVEPVDDQHAKLYGELTIKDVTKEVALDVEYLGSATSPWGQTSAGFVASGKINRADWGLTWNQALEAGGVLVGEEIGLGIDVELIKQAEGEGEAVAAD